MLLSDYGSLLIIHYRACPFFVKCLNDWDLIRCMHLFDWLWFPGIHACMTENGSLPLCRTWFEENWRTYSGITLCDCHYAGDASALDLVSRVLLNAGTSVPFVWIVMMLNAWFLMRYVWMMNFRCMLIWCLIYDSWFDACDYWSYMCGVVICINLQFTKLCAYCLVVTNFQVIREKFSRVCSEAVDRAGFVFGIFCHVYGCRVVVPFV